MSRRTTPRRQAARRRARARQQEQEMRATLTEWANVTAAPPLANVALRNRATTRAAVSATFAAKPDPGVLPHTPPRDSAKIPTPRTVWQAATGDTAPVPIPDGARPAKEPKPIKISELPDAARDGVRDLAKFAKEKGILSREWVSLGGVERNGKTGPIYARLHGNSVRYAVEA